MQHGEDQKKARSSEYLLQITINMSLPVLVGWNKEYKWFVAYTLVCSDTFVCSCSAVDLFILWSLLSACRYTYSCLVLSPGTEVLYSFTVFLMHVSCKPDWDHLSIGSMMKTHAVFSLMLISVQASSIKISPSMSDRQPFLWVVIKP